MQENVTNTRRSAWWFGTAQEGTPLYAWFASFDVTGSAISNLVGMFGQMEEAGHKHCHVLLHFKPGKEFRYMKTRFPGAHWEIPANPRKCFEYCHKGEGGFPHEHGDTYVAGTRKSHGTPPRADRKSDRGRRVDIELAVQAAVEGMPPAKFYREGMRSAQAWQIFMAGRVMFNTRPERERHCIWLWGGTGVGKTAMSSTFPGPHARMSATGQWCTTPNVGKFNTLQIDDIADGYQIRELLRVADRYPVELPIKGGHIHHTADWVVVTSDRLPSQLKDGRGRDLIPAEVSQIERRFDIIHLPHGEVWCFCSYVRYRGLAVDTTECSCSKWGGGRPGVRAAAPGAAGSGGVGTLQRDGTGRTARADSPSVLPGHIQSAARDEPVLVWAGTPERGSVGEDLPTRAGDQRHDTQPTARA